MPEPSRILQLERLRQELPHLTRSYQTADPFPHLALDGLVASDVLAEAVTEFLPPDSPGWIAHKHTNSNKLGSSGRAALPPTVGRIIDALNAPEFVSLLEQITGIRPLLIDETLAGGGMHQSVRGGFLNVHADFSVHPQHLDWRRRLNVIVYLNQDWKEEYNGQLELWSRDMARCAKRVTPLFNRWVLFATDDTSFHGHPVPLACPPSLTRKSLALYYYTKETATLRVRSTEYRGRPGDSLFRRAAIRTSTLALRYYSAMKRRMRGTGDEAETLEP